MRTVSEYILLGRDPTRCTKKEFCILRENCVTQQGFCTPLYLRIMHPLVDQILAHIKLVSDDGEKLQKILTFLEKEICEEEKTEPPVVPEQYRPLVSEIAQNIQCSWRCYLNMDTLELELIMVDEFNCILWDYIEVEDELSFKHCDWKNCQEFAPLHSSDSFKMMKDFVEQLKEGNLKKRLEVALCRNKPFANFRRVLDPTAQLNNWYEFRNMACEEHVKQLILEKLGLDARTLHYKEVGATKYEREKE